MTPAEEGEAPPPDPMEEFREVVPARAVLTELARGFLLVQASNPDRAVEFASTFLREYVGAPTPNRPEGTRPMVIPPRRRPEPGAGATDPSNNPPVL